jgi:hypothetical protein
MCSYSGWVPVTFIATISNFDVVPSYVLKIKEMASNTGPLFYLKISFVSFRRNSTDTLSRRRSNLNEYDKRAYRKWIPRLVINSYTHRIGKAIPL